MSVEQSPADASQRAHGADRPAYRRIPGPAAVWADGGTEACRRLSEPEAWGGGGRLTLWDPACFTENWGQPAKRPAFVSSGRQPQRSLTLCPCLTCKPAAPYTYTDAVNVQHTYL